MDQLFDICRAYANLDAGAARVLKGLQGNNWDDVLAESDTADLQRAMVFMDQAAGFYYDMQKAGDLDERTDETHSAFSVIDIELEERRIAAAQPK